MSEEAKRGRRTEEEEGVRKRRMPKRDRGDARKKQDRHLDAPSGTGPRPGEPAPDFELPVVEGAGYSTAPTRTLSALRGHKPVVIFFFPRPGSPSCNRIAGDFNELYDQIKQRGVALYGICNDPPSKLAKFAADLGLRYPLLHDQGGRIAAFYGAYALKVHQGRSYRGVSRSTFLIDRKGTVVRAWNRVHVKGHAAHVLAEIDAQTL
jgi:peroxiredoxin Q/BCP